MEINKLKIINDVGCSEELFDIEQPAEYQCPKIDSLIKSMSLMESLTKVTNHTDEDDMRSQLSDIEHEVYGIDSQLEELREAIESVRTWGESWKKVVKNLIERDLVDLEEYGLLPEKETSI
ncbi:hypothetical protein [Peribacillus simplex]|uniref:hypothetical protein n=1 Tax=Peribacillus simplex TaxID=1478 RepID=UPI003D26A30C